MKKVMRILWLIIGCLFLMLVCLAVGFAAGKEKLNKSTLQIVDEVEDKYGNILQQIYYNERTDEYLLKEYTYIYEKGDFICINQKTKIVANSMETKNNCTELNDTFEIYHNKDLTYGPIILMDNEDVKISIVKHLAADRWWEFGYELKIVNKSNKVLSVLIDDTSIMDIQCKPLFSVEHVDAGHTAYFTIAWQEEELERCHIPYIDNVQFMIRVFDNENWKMPALYGNKILMKIGE